MKRLRWLVVGLVVGIIGSNGMGASLQAFPYVKDLREQSYEGRGFGWFELDAEVLRILATDFSNLRVADSLNQQIPFTVKLNGGRERAYHVESLSVEQDGRTTLIRFDAKGLPVKTIFLDTTDENFVRKVVVDGEGRLDDQVGYRRLASDTISVVRVGDVDKRKTFIRLPGVSRCDRYRIRIENEDNPPLVVTAVALRGPVAEVRFLNGKERDFRLFYGGYAARPRYDLNEVLRSGGSVEGDEYALDWQADNQDYSPLRAAGSGAGRAILIGAMILAMLALGWLVLLSIRRVDRLRPGGE